MRMFNPDGTEDMCGNGLRCAGLWAYRAGWLGGAGQFKVAVKDGTRSLRILDICDGGRSAIIGADMGVPRFAPADLPFSDTSVACVRDYPLSVDGRAFAVSTINTGSTHTVIFGEPVTEDDFQRYSPLIENHALFPERTTVLWAAVRGPSAIDVRIWERGVGETIGCGTGACAVAVAATNLGLVEGSAPVDIVSRGGVLRVTWNAPDGTIDLVGPATFVFEGDSALGA
jgi:diaminopimelate epimerase